MTFASVLSPVTPRVPEAVRSPDTVKLAEVTFSSVLVPVTSRVPEAVTPVTIIVGMSFLYPVILTIQMTHLHL